MAESKMPKIKMSEFKMTAIIKLESEWMSEVFLMQSQSGNQSVFEWSVGEFDKVSEYKMALSESKMARIQVGHHHQVKWDWMSLSQF